MTGIDVNLEDSFYGRVAIVTGAASGIGAELTRLLTAGGASVLAADLDEQALGDVAAETGCQIMVVDVGEAAANDSLVTAAVDAFGGLDLAFLNAGILGRTYQDQALPYTPDQLELDRYPAVMAVNVDGVVRGSLAAWKAMALSGGGAIVATSSAAGLVPWGPDPFYTATKHAVVGWVRAIAGSMAQAGVTINAICPGGVATPLVGVTEAGERPNLLSATEVAQAMIDTALETGTGRAMSVVAGRDPVRQEHEFNPIPGFG